jgi:hypothetical protein
MDTLFIVFIVVLLLAVFGGLFIAKLLWLLLIVALVFLVLALRNRA